MGSKKPTSRSRKPSFFKVLLGDFSKRLRIPREFIKHLKGKLPGKFNLRSLNGTCWCVKVKKNKDDWVFQKGWNRFVRYHSLKIGEFLVFSYRGNSKFRVTIYDRSACEKELPLAKKKRNDHEEEEECNISHIKTEEEQQQPGSQANTLFTKKAVKPCTHKIKINGRLEAVSLVETEHPHLTQIWRPEIKYMITVPRALAAETGLIDKERILLWDPQGRSWPVTLNSRTDGRVEMRSGWPDFWKGNNLERGDACVFEFLQQETGDDAIRVHIFRALVNPGLQEVLILE